MSEILPTVGPPEDGVNEAAGSPETNGASELPQDTSPPAWRLLSTLAVAGALAGLLLVLVFQATDPAIQAHRARVLAEAVNEVLGSPDRYETLFLVDGALAADPAGVDTAGLERVYRGYDASGSPVGFAIEGGEPGFQDVIGLIFGFDAASGNVLGMKVLESKETPGLGDKIEKDSTWVAAFRGVPSPILGVKRGQGTGAEGEVEMITGATISSRAIIDIINHRLEDLGDVLRTFEAERSASSGRAVAAPTASREGGR